MNEILSQQYLMETNESLYAPNPKKTPIKGTGFKDAKKAKETLKIIKNLDENHQVWIVTTMYNRAKYHPNRTLNMEKAMEIFDQWLQKRKEKQSRYFPMLRKREFNKIKDDIVQLRLGKNQKKLLQHYVEGKEIPMNLLLERYQNIKNILKKSPENKSKLLSWLYQE